VYVYRKLRNQWQLLGSAMNTPVGVVNIPFYLKLSSRTLVRL
jgi:hypothetical protein